MKTEFGPQTATIGSYPLFTKTPWHKEDVFFWMNTADMNFGSARLYRVPAEHIACTVGANPCMAFAVLSHGDIWIGHSSGSTLLHSQHQYILDATSGVFGGGIELLQQHEKLSSIGTVLFPPLQNPDDWWFNIAVVTKTHGPIPYGIHVGYMNRKEIFE